MGTWTGGHRQASHAPPSRRPTSIDSITLSDEYALENARRAAVLGGCSIMNLSPFAAPIRMIYVLPSAWTEPALTAKAGPVARGASPGGDSSPAIQLES
jgi:hypothetical protein